MSNWTVTAHRVLQERDPKLFEKLRKTKAKHPATGEETTELHLYLDRKAKEASQVYKETVRLAEKNHRAWFARYQAEELVVRDILDPTT